MTTLRNFSVSQVNLFLDCNRKHFLKHILRLPDPSNEAAQRGVNIHKASENTSIRLSKGTPLLDALAATDTTDAPWMSYVHALAKAGVLPEPGESVATEHRFSLPTHTGIPFIGVIDEILEDRRPVRIIDLKSVSDIRYAKKPFELLTDLQLAVYGHYAFTILDEDVVRAELAYVEAKKVPLKTKLPRTMVVGVDLERDHVRRIWQGELPFGPEGKHHLPLVLDRMLENSKIEDFNDVTPNTATCSKYGGCPYAGKCGISTFAGIGSAFNHEPRKRITIQESKNMGFLGKNNGTSQNAAPAPVPPTTTTTTVKAAPPAAAPKTTGFLARAQAAKGTAGPVDEAARKARLDRDFGPTEVPTGVTPPDAPSRMTRMVQAEPEAVSEEDAAPAVEAAQEAPKKRGRPPKVKAPVDDIPYDTNGEMSSAAPTPRAAKARSFVIMIDVAVVKGNGGIEATLLDDFFSTIEMELNEMAAAEENLPSYWLLPFAGQKAALAMKVQERIAKGLPPVMAVRSSSNAAREVLPFLLPHATQVFQGIRG